MILKILYYYTTIISIGFCIPTEHHHHQQNTPSNEHLTEIDENEIPVVKYEFGYSVHDELSGDIKSHHEIRDDDIVHGRYELIDSDGYRRIVEYYADKNVGFNAVVHREPTDIKIPSINRIQKIPVKKKFTSIN